MATKRQVRSLRRAWIRLRRQAVSLFAVGLVAYVLWCVVPAHCRHHSGSYAPGYNARTVCLYDTFDKGGDDEAPQRATVAIQAPVPPLPEPAPLEPHFVLSHPQSHPIPSTTLHAQRVLLLI